MQIYALDAADNYISASQAGKGIDYCCMECGKVVRKRSGAHRRPHFFHLDPSDACRQNGKSMTHLQVQFHIANALSKKELLNDSVALEWRHKRINRIADVVWLTHKLIFEIQCSPISAEEIYQRSAAWRSIGYEVVWILHENRFNKKRITFAESTFFNLIHYFTSINHEGNGIIYDQYQKIEGGFRQKKGAPLPIDLSEPHFFYKNLREENFLKSLPGTVRKRAAHRCNFSGDLVDHWMMALEGAGALYDQLAQELNGKEPANFFLSFIIKLPKYIWQKFIRDPYLSFLRFLLEQASG